MIDIFYQTDVAGNRIHVIFLKSIGFQTSRGSKNKFNQKN
jgi:hypothetical protein